MMFCFPIACLIEGKEIEWRGALVISTCVCGFLLNDESVIIDKMMLFGVSCSVSIHCHAKYRLVVGSSLALIIPFCLSTFFEYR